MGELTQIICEPKLKWMEIVLFCVFYTNVNNSGLNNRLQNLTVVGSNLDLNKTLCEYEMEVTTNHVSSSARQHYALATFTRHHEVRDPLCQQPAVRSSRSCIASGLCWLTVQVGNALSETQHDRWYGRAAVQLRVLFNSASDSGQST